jgi:hypothetical protein
MKKEQLIGSVSRVKTDKSPGLVFLLLDYAANHRNAEVAKTP